MFLLCACVSVLMMAPHLSAQAMLQAVGGRLGPQELGSGVPSAPAAYSRRPVGETVILMTPPFYPY